VGPSIRCHGNSHLSRSLDRPASQRRRREKADQGGYAYGAPPYGWRAHQKDLAEEETEQAGRARARQLRNEGKLSYREIAAALDAEEIRPKRGERWHPETVRRMLANDTYMPPTLRRRTS
jgi:DNA invertase Pin-like site-specific DNA recombinase